MNRTINFRAWDKESGRMINGFALTAQGKIMFTKKRGADGKYSFKDRSDEGYGDERYVLMQYTGLKDAKGVEIYEGDIFDMGVVIFDRGCFNGCYIESRNNEKGWDYSDAWEDGLYSYASKHEVKGNIYENPELLTN